MQAKASPRLRMNLDLRNSPDDKSQRMLNALEPGTIMPIHRHQHSSETVIVVRGKVEFYYYNDLGQVLQTILVEANGPTWGLSIPIGQWHNLKCIESGSVIMECKDGPWEPLNEKDILNEK